MEIPSRSLSNVRYNSTKRFIEMGSGKNRRELFNLSQAKSYMQTMLVSKGCKQLIEESQDHQHSWFVLLAQAHDRGIKRGDI